MLREREECMSNETQWVATWEDDSGCVHALVFFSEDNLTVARFDFQIKLMARGEKVPNADDLEIDTWRSLQPLRKEQASPSTGARPTESIVHAREGTQKESTSHVPR